MTFERCPRADEWSYAVEFSGMRAVTSAHTPTVARRPRMGRETEWWSSHLKEPTEAELFHLEQLCSVWYRDLAQAVTLCSVERFPSCNHFLLTLASRNMANSRHNRTVQSLELLVHLLDHEIQSDEQLRMELEILDLLQTLERHDEILKLVDRLLHEMDSTDPKAWDAVHQCVVKAVESCYALGQYQRAVAYFYRVTSAMWSATLVGSARSLWYHGLRVDFGNLLRFFTTLPDAETQYLRETLALYEKLEQLWSVEEVRELTQLQPL